MENLLPMKIYHSISTAIRVKVYTQQSEMNLNYCFVSQSSDKKLKGWGFRSESSLVAIMPQTHGGV